MKTLLSTHLTGGRISSIDPYSHTVERNTLGYINPIKTSDGEDGVHPFHGVGDQVLRWNSRDEISQGGFSHKGLLPPARTQDHPHRPSIRTQSKTLPLGHIEIPGSSAPLWANRRTTQSGNTLGGVKR